MNLGILLLLKKHWKVVLFTIIFILILDVGFGFLIGSLACSCITGVFGVPQPRGFGNAGGNQNTTSSAETPNPSQTLEEDCATKIIRKANPSVSVDEAKNYVKWANQYGGQNGISPAILLAQIYKESTFNKNAVSSSNAKGLAQLKNAAWQDAGNIDTNGNGSDPFDPQDNIASQAAYLNKVNSWLDSGLKNNIKNILAGYYVGAGTVNKYKGVPPDNYEGTANKPTSYINTILGEFYPPFKKCLGGPEIPSSTKGDIIIFHWTAGGYNAVYPNKYNYNIKGDGSIVKGPGGNHAVNRNDNSIGVTICAGGGRSDSSKYPNDNVLGTNTFKDYPIRQVQYDAMITLIAQLAKDNNIPVDKDHIMSHAEAGALKDYPKEKVKKYSKPLYSSCANASDDAAAIKDGLPHCNYGPGSWKDGWPGSPSPYRWEYWEHEDQIRSDIRKK